MAEVNAVGDLVLTQAHEFRALAGPHAIELTDRLRREGPATTTALAERLETPAAPIRTALETLERSGIVTRDDETWSAVARGFVFEIPDEPEAQAAGRELANAMLLQYVDLPRRWVAVEEPRLEPEWVRAAGLFNARPALTAEELDRVQEQLEELVEPYLTRGASEVPANARRVRVLAYFLPEPPA